MQVDALIPRMYACPIKPTTEISAQCETEQTNESVTPVTPVDEESDTVSQQTDEDELSATPESDTDVHHMLDLVEQIEPIELPLQSVSIRATIKGTTRVDVT